MNFGRQCFLLTVGFLLIIADSYVQGGQLKRSEWKSKLESLSGN